MTPIAKSISVLVPGCSAYLAIVQAIAPVDLNLIGSIERLGLVGALIIAVVDQRRENRAIQKKRDEEQHLRDEARDAEYKAALAVQMQMAAALALSTETMDSVKEVVEALKISMDKFVNVRAALEEHAAKKPR